jgi:drug/metabolite transporter (DMT)-like permease
MVVEGGRVAKAAQRGFDDGTAKLDCMPSTPLASDSRRTLWIGAGCAVAVLLIWTSFILVARSSATRSLTAFDIAWLRFVFSGLLVLPVLAWRWPRFLAGLGPTSTVAFQRLAALAGIAGMGYCMLAYSGFFFAPVSHAAVLLPGSLPLWTALLAWLWLGESLSRGRALGLGLIACGGVFVGGVSLLRAFDSGDTWKGDLLFMAASLSWASYGVLCRRWRIGAVDATLAIALGCLVSYVPVYGLGVLAGAIASHLGTAPWREIAFQAIYQGGLSMLAAGLAYTQVIQTFGPLRTTMLTALVPPLAALLAVPLLGEPLGLPALVGLACVGLGLMVGLRAAAPRSSQPGPVAAAGAAR